MIRNKLALTIVAGGLLASTWLRAEVVNIDNEELSRLLAAGTPIIDIRTEPEWRDTGVVKSSQLLTFFDESGKSDPAAWLDKVKGFTRPADPVIVICRSGNRTRAVARFLDQQAGYKKVYNVKHGINDWLKDKRPTVAAEPLLAACKSTGKC